MTVEYALRGVPPQSLGPARAIAHKAVQLATMAARANLVTAPDDSHSNLGWDSRERRFLSQPITNSQGSWFVSVSLSPLCVALVREEETIELRTLDNISMRDAAVWLDVQLAKAGLKPASGVELPYALPSDVDAVDVFDQSTGKAALATLSSWFDLANALISDFAIEQEGLNPGPSPVRCWPHHFDIATYVSLEAGDFETARGIGVGMSPGDENYAQPYFYINPWPHLDASDLPPLPPPGHWHTQGFVGAIATADDILELEDISKELRSLVDQTFTYGRNELGV